MKLLWEVKLYIGLAVAAVLGLALLWADEEYGHWHIVEWNHGKSYDVVWCHTWTYCLKPYNDLNMDQANRLYQVLEHPAPPPVIEKFIN